MKCSESCRITRVQMVSELKFFGTVPVEHKETQNLNRVFGTIPVEHKETQNLKHAGLAGQRSGIRYIDTKRAQGDSTFESPRALLVSPTNFTALTS